MIRELLDEYNEKFNQKHGDNDYIIETDYLAELAYILEFYNIFFKPKAYKNEQEYRFVIYYDNISKTDKIDCNFRIHNDIFIPYLKIDLPQNYIKEIMVSPAINQRLLQRGVNIIKNNSIYKDAKTSLSEIDKRY